MIIPPWCFRLYYSINALGSARLTSNMMRMSYRTLWSCGSKMGYDSRFNHSHSDSHDYSSFVLSQAISRIDLNSTQGTHKRNGRHAWFRPGLRIFEKPTVSLSRVTDSAPFKWTRWAQDLGWSSYPWHTGAFLFIFLPTSKGRSH